MDSQALAERIRDIVLDKKGMDPVLVDVRGTSSVTDFYLVVSGNSPAHVKALFNEVQVQLKAQDIRCFRKTGEPESGWMAIDYVDVIVHIFTPDKRDYYALEALWDRRPEAD